MSGRRNSVGHACLYVPTFSHLWRMEGELSCSMCLPTHHFPIPSLRAASSSMKRTSCISITQAVETDRHDLTYPIFWKTVTRLALAPPRFLFKRLLSLYLCPFAFIDPDVSCAMQHVYVIQCACRLGRQWWMTVVAA